ncbi:AAA family ATPase [Photobacterium sp. J15]|uniref:AAA family ATPase n=1 Tax=Photobacterium sp. J15 TaxID=265901 RepID=UPI0007E42A92|nr:ATP-dependent RecD-like DNA helicase [Photobacterium sp. J15]
MNEIPKNIQYSADNPFVTGNVRMYFRITYVHYDERNDKCYVRGTVNKREKRNAYTAISRIKVNTTCFGLPSVPAKGEYWQAYGQVEYYTEEKYNSIKHIFHYKQPQSLEFMMPNTPEEVSEFVSKSGDFPMIGASRIFNIWDKYNDEALQIILDGDIEKLTAVDLMSEENAKTLVEGFKKYENLKYAAWFAKHRIPPMVQHSFFKMKAVMEIQDGEEIKEVKMPPPPEVITDNPYQLITLGMKFADIDKMALSTFNKPLDDKNRLVAAVNQVLLEDVVPRGHTFAYHSQISARVAKVLNSTELAEQALIQSEKMLNFRRGENGTYHHGSLYLMECIIAERFSTLLKRKSEWTDEHPVKINTAMAEVPFCLAPKQVDAIFSALENEVSIISGGAGTGKTTVLRTVLKAFEELGYTIHGIALSGRAALRLFESIRIPTKTITRFLGDSDLCSEDAEGNPLKHLVVIDESSMVDTLNMSRIVTHTCPEVRFLIVGDDEQLAPIGAGKILYDLIQSGVVPCVELDQVQRQDESTGIPEYSRVIRSGKVPEELSFKNVHFHECREADIVDKCIEIYQHNRGRSQMISATRKTTWALNTNCQAMFNAYSPKLTYEYLGRTIDSNFRQFDPVIFTKNHIKLGIQNGLLGELSSIQWDEAGYGVVNPPELEERISLSPQLITELQLAYSITLHKAQGSQFPVVIVAMDNSGLIDRSWLYTAITRAEVEVHIVGTKAKFIQAVTGGNKGHRRQTYLQELIHKSLGSAGLDAA